MKYLWFQETQRSWALESAVLSALPTLVQLLFKLWVTSSMKPSQSSGDGSLHPLPYLPCGQSNKTPIYFLLRFWGTDLGTEGTR